MDGNNSKDKESLTPSANRGNGEKDSWSRDLKKVDDDLCIAVENKSEGSQLPWSLLSDYKHPYHKPTVKHGWMDSDLFFTLYNLHGGSMKCRAVNNRIKDEVNFKDSSKVILKSIKELVSEIRTSNKRGAGVKLKRTLKESAETEKTNKDTSKKKREDAKPQEPMKKATLVKNLKLREAMAFAGVEPNPYENDLYKVYLKYK